MLLQLARNISHRTLKQTGFQTLIVREMGKKSSETAEERKARKEAVRLQKQVSEG
jgi:hypothetical protein